MHTVPAALPSNLPSCTPSSWVLTLSFFPPFPVKKLSGLLHSPCHSLYPSCTPPCSASFLFLLLLPSPQSSFCCPRFLFTMIFTSHFTVQTPTRASKALVWQMHCLLLPPVPASFYAALLILFFTLTVAVIPEYNLNDIHKYIFAHTVTSMDTAVAHTSKQTAMQLCRGSGWQVYFPLHPTLSLPPSVCLISSTTDSHMYTHPPVKGLSRYRGICIPNLTHGFFMLHSCIGPGCTAVGRQCKAALLRLHWHCKHIRDTTFCLIIYKTFIHAFNFI